VIGNPAGTWGAPRPAIKATAVKFCHSERVRTSVSQAMNLPQEGRVYRGRGGMERRQRRNGRRRKNQSDNAKESDNFFV